MSLFVAMAVGYIARESVNPNQPSTTLRSAAVYGRRSSWHAGQRRNHISTGEREREREAFTTGRELRSEKRS